MLDGVTLSELSCLMHEHVSRGGKIGEVRETRPEWSSDYEYHHDLVLTVEGKGVYVETRLRFHPPFKPDSSSILVVNIHG